MKICPICHEALVCQQGHVLSDAEPPFEQTSLKSWEDIHDYVVRDRHQIYRGDSALRPLATSLERRCARQRIPVEKRRDLERRLCREFRRGYHHYSSTGPGERAHLEWFSLMQHYGAPTRLLDFTYSIYVAAYFALEKADRDREGDEYAVVWSIDADWSLSESCRLFEGAGRPSEVISTLCKPYEEHDDEDAFNTAFLGDEPVLCAAPQNPFRLNERLRVQKGVFLVPGDIGRSFQENLCALDGHNNAERVLIIKIPLSERERAVRALTSMNISRTSLFPGLQGYAESLGIYSPLQEDSPWPATPPDSP